MTLTETVADLLGTDTTGLAVLIVFLAAIYLWVNRKGRRR